MSTNETEREHKHETVTDDAPPTDALSDEVKTDAVDASGQLDDADAEANRIGDEASDGSESGTSDEAGTGDDVDGLRQTGYEGA
jgi:hypothetical protein